MAYLLQHQHDVSYFDKWSNKFLTLNQILKIVYTIADNK